MMKRKYSLLRNPKVTPKMAQHQIKREAKFVEMYH